MKKVKPAKMLNVTENTNLYTGNLPVEEPKLKTTDQIATRYQVSRRTIAYWKEDGTLPFFKKGRVVRFDADDCDRAMEAFRRKARNEVM